MTTLAPTLEAYFTDRRPRQQPARSPSAATAIPSRCCSHSCNSTVGSRRRSRRSPTWMRQRSASSCEHLETDRGEQPPHPQHRPGGDPLVLSLRRSTPRALRAEPARARDPTKRARKRTVTFLTKEELPALLDAPDRGPGQAAGPRAAAYRRRDRPTDLRAHNTGP